MTKEQMQKVIELLRQENEKLNNEKKNYDFILKERVNDINELKLQLNNTKQTLLNATTDMQAVIDRQAEQLKEFKSRFIIV